MSRVINKKIWPESEYFNAILKEDKTFELQLNDFECESGDILVLKEWNPETKEFTGRELKKKITYVIKTKDSIKFYSQEKINKYGFQVIGFK